MERTPLKHGDSLTLVRKNGDSAVWKILRCVGEGASCICYVAQCGNVQGRLKEFFPIELGLSRNEKNLSANLSGTIAELYKSRASEFLNALATVEELRNREPVLNNFLPPVQEILFDSSKGNANVWVWMPHDRHGVTAEEYFRTVPSTARQLRGILQLGLSLSEFLKALHCAGFVHLDLKPANVLLTTNETGQVNPRQITVFDSDSLVNLKDANQYSTRGTAGFSAPEFSSGSFDNRSDLFSVGAILFEGLFGRHYTHEDYSALAQSVSQAAVAETLSGKAQRLLTSILQQTLAQRPWRRFNNAEALHENLTVLLEKMTSPDNDENAEAWNSAIQSLLWKSTIPLSKRINVAVVGDGVGAQIFLDKVLQVVQVPGEGREVFIKLFSLNARETCETYLRGRPALKDFITVNGTPAQVESYACVDFLPAPDLEGLSFSADNFNVNRLLVSRLSENFDGEISYVFVALDSDKLNRLTAEAFDCVLGSNGQSCPVNFVLRGNGLQKFSSPFLQAVNLNDAPDKELERLALNTHISWLGTLNVDMETVRKNFSGYDRSASLDFALSIRYKLRAVGIEDENLSQAVFAFAEKIQDDEIFSALSDFEHRRWLMDKCALGFQAPRNADGSLDFEHCIASLRLNGKPQDDKFHPCLIPYDELDAMSSGFHKALVARAATIKRTSFDEQLKSLRNALRGDRDGLQALGRLEFFLRQIRSGNPEHSRKCRSYFSEFKNALPEHKNIAEATDTLRKDFLVLAEANLSRDYRAYDGILVRQVPFIVTYKQPRLAAVFDRDSAISNIASATVLNPLSITYLIIFDDKAATANIPEKLKTILNYFRARKIRAEVKLVAAVLVDGFDDEKFRAVKLNDISVKFCENYAEVVDFFGQALKSDEILFDCGAKIFGDESEQSALLNEVAAQVPHFRFDFLAKNFSLRAGCEYLKFIKDEATFLSVEEFFLLNGFKVRMSGHQVNIDFGQKLFDIFSEDVPAALKCFKALERADLRQKFVANLKKIGDANSAKTMLFFLPGYAAPFVDGMLENFHAAQVVSNFTLRTEDNSLLCKIQTDAENESAFGAIFGKISELLEAEIEMTETNTTIEVAFKNFAEVKNLPVDAEISEVLKRLADSRLIVNCVAEGNRVNFRCASRSIGKILSAPSEAIKTFLFMAALKNGKLDDMAVDVTAEGFGAEQNFDLVLTKGFRSGCFKIFREENLSAPDEFVASGGNFGIAVLPFKPSEEFTRRIKSLVRILTPEDFKNLSENLLRILPE